MNAFYGLGILAAILYGIIVDGTFFKIYLILIVAYIIFTQLGTLSKFNNKRKKATIATWNAPNDPQIFANLEWDITYAQEYLQQQRKETGHQITLTHLVGYCISRAMSNQPDVNGRIAFGNYYPKDQLDISFLVAMEKGKDLGACKISNADKKQLVDFALELSSTCKNLRGNKDEDHKNRTLSLGFIPTFIIEPIMHCVGYIATHLNINLTSFGFKKNAFGSCMITSIGMLGFEQVFVPLPPFANVPVLITVGAIKKKPLIVDDKIEMREVINVTLTLDHRYTDGARVSNIYKKFENYLHHPELIELEENSESDTSVSLK